MYLHINLPWKRVAPVRAQRPAVPDWVNATVCAVPADNPAAVHLCGWFDSSHELNAGLNVTEHLNPDAVAKEVPLGWWLDWQVNGTTASAQSACGLR